jgi:signal transduction histidine kinase
LIDVSMRTADGRLGYGCHVSRATVQKTVQTANPEPATASTQTERYILRVFAVVRLAALGQGPFFIAGSWSRYDHPLWTVMAMGLALTSSIVVVTIGWRHGGLIRPWLAVLDIAATITAVVIVDAAITPGADALQANALYPYSAVAVAIIGFVPVRIRWAVLAAALASGMYVTVTSARFGFHAGLLGNAATYWAYALASSVLTSRFRQMGRWLDEARREAVDRERALVERHERAERDRERAETWRTLHDNVLQTMETLSRGTPLPADVIRRNVGREAARLRALIHNELDAHPPELIGALQALAVEHGEAGLDVQLNVAAAGAYPIGAAALTALTGATQEALTNVRKHAGVRYCVVRAVAGPAVASVIVVDQGCGFDPAAVGSGLGLAQSVVARVQAVGGEVCITSEPGAGTIVELTVPTSLVALQPAR